MKCDCHICNGFSWEVENFLMKDEQTYDPKVDEKYMVITAAWDMR